MDIHKKWEIPGLIAGDFFGLMRVCGPGIALSWLSKIASNFGACRRSSSLIPADDAMGPGPFNARFGSARARVYGELAIGLIREIWARDVYLIGSFLTIRPDAVVLDLGANIGVFTTLALAHGPDVRVVCIEAIQDSVDKLHKSLEANDWTDRATVIHALVGDKTDTQEEIMATGQTKGASFITEDELIRLGDLKRIDLLKCDIEGSEYGLLHPDSKLLAMADQIAIELHKWVSPAEPFLDMLRKEGFELKLSHDSPGDLVVSGRRRMAS